MFSVSTGPIGLGLSRFFLGLSEAPLFPLFVSWIAKNSSRIASSTHIGIVEAASYIGMAFSGPVTVALATDFGWRFSYSISAVFSIIVGIIAILCFPNEPKTNNSNNALDKTSGRAQVVSTTFIFCALGFLLYNFMKTFHSTWLPTILIDNFQFTSERAASVTFLQSIIAPFAAILMAVFSSVLLSKRKSLAFARLFPMTIGFCLGSSILLGGMGFSSIATFSIASFVGIISTSALIWSVPVDIAQRTNFVATISGFLNAIANVGTIISPIVIGYVLDIHNGWGYVLILIGLVSITALSCFAVGYFYKRSKQEIIKLGETQ